MVSEQTPASRLWQVPDGDLAEITVAREEKLRAFDGYWDPWSVCMIAPASEPRRSFG